MRRFESNRPHHVSVPPEKSRVPRLLYCSRAPSKHSVQTRPRRRRSPASRPACHRPGRCRDCPRLRPAGRAPPAGRPGRGELRGHNHAQSQQDSRRSHQMLRSNAWQCSYIQLTQTHAQGSSLATDPPLVWAGARPVSQCPRQDRSDKGAGFTSRQTTTHLPCGVPNKQQHKLQ